MANMMRNLMDFAPRLTAVFQRCLRTVSLRFSHEDEIRNEDLFERLNRLYSDSGWFNIDNFIYSLSKEPIDENVFQRLNRLVSESKWFNTDNLRFSLTRESRDENLFQLLNRLIFDSGWLNTDNLRFSLRSETKDENLFQQMGKTLEKLVSGSTIVSEYIWIQLAAIFKTVAALIEDISVLPVVVSFGFTALAIGLWWQYKPIGKERNPDYDKSIHGDDTDTNCDSESLVTQESSRDLDESVKEEIASSLQGKTSEPVNDTAISDEIPTPNPEITDTTHAPADIGYPLDNTPQLPRHDVPEIPEKTPSPTDTASVQDKATPLAVSPETTDETPSPIFGISDNISSTTDKAINIDMTTTALFKISDKTAPLNDKDSLPDETPPPGDALENMVEKPPSPTDERYASDKARQRGSVVTITSDNRLSADEQCYTSAHTPTAETSHSYSFSSRGRIEVTPSNLFISPVGSLDQSACIEADPPPISGRIYHAGQTLPGNGDTKLMVLDTLGSGNQATLYKVEDGRSTYAAKISPDGDISPELKSEFNILKSLNHKNVVAVYEKIPEGFLLDCLSQDLKTFLYNSGHVQPKVRDRLAIGILEGVDYIHSKGIAHLDIKPDNVLLTAYGIPKLCDFGFSVRYLNPDGSMFDLQYYIGTRHYVSPEMCSKGIFASIDVIDLPKSDCWSVGATLYEIMTGELLFLGNKDREVFWNQRGNNYNYPPLFADLSPVDIDYYSFMEMIKGLCKNDVDTRLSARGALNHKCFDIH